jgi:hypothetical protein
MASRNAGFDTFILNGSNATAVLRGDANQIFVNGGTDSFTDDSHGLVLDIGAAGGSVTLANILADPTARIELSDGIGGYTNVRSVLASLRSDGHGGTLLPLGASSQIDFAGVQPSQLTATRFELSGIGHGV